MRSMGLGLSVSFSRMVMAVLLAAALVAYALFAGLVAVHDVRASEEPDPDWELWALDQGEGINRIHVYNKDLEEQAVIDFAELDAPHNIVQTPHMISFDLTNQYAVVSSTASGTATVIRTEDYEVIATLETGAGSHMALFTFDNDAIWTADIGAKTLTKIDVDLENEEFQVAERIDLTANIQAEGWEGWQEQFGDDLADWPGPVCHAFTPGGEFLYVSLGPAAGGMAVIDTATGEIVQAFDPREVRANCGLALNAGADEMYANWGGPVDQIDQDNLEGDPGEWYVFDITTHEHVDTYNVNDGSETLGLDPHGVIIRPEGSELWMLNRVSNDGVVIDTTTHEVIDDLQLSDTPDVIGFSPDGTLAFVALRGPNPVSMPHVAVGNTPGFEVIDAETRESIEIIQPAAEDELEASDFHAVGIRGPIDADRQPEDLLPATGGRTSEQGAMITLLALFAAGTLGAGVLLRSRQLRF